jgi:cyclopropane fatty-acyl-phospholipid synthase-like methyltransferase
LDTNSIRRYYEENTRLFLRFVPTPGTYTIHRALWADGVATQNQALNYSNELLLTEILSHAQQHSLERLQILDLGCGVGGSLFYLLTRLTTPAFGTGITLSGTQAHIARQRAQQAGMADKCNFIEGDFQSVPIAGNVDAVYSIEAFVHSTHPEKYLSEVARLLKPNGKLILCDDYLADRALDSSDRRWLDAYQDGWFVPNVKTISHLTELARTHNLHLVSNRHLTPYLRLRALPNFFAEFLLAIGKLIPRFHAIVPSMLGSMALQQCLKMGIVEYHFLVFEKLG